MKLKKGHASKSGENSPQKGCSRMKTAKKWMPAVCMSMMLLAGLTGCTKTTEATPQSQEETGNGEDDQMAPENPDGDAQKNDQEAQGNLGVDMQENDQEAQGNPDVDMQENDQATTESVSFNEGTEFLGGKVQSVEEDGMIFAQTTIKGEDDSMVTLVDEKDAKKISVKFTADTKVEHWTIQGGGAGIDRKDAQLSDLKPGLGVELEGLYEGEAFVAARILIEEYK